jgi:hypothetical protein
MFGEPPFTEHLPTAERFIKGLPSSVYCCWNGLAIINAQIFYKGIQFRDSNLQKNECLASEISFFCQDMWQKNFTKVLMEPFVRVTYELEIHEKINHMYWMDTNPDLFLHKDIPFFERPTNWTCCNLYGTGNDVNFSQCFQQPIPYWDKSNYEENFQ